VLDYPALLHPILILAMSATLPIHAVHDSGNSNKVADMRRIRWTAYSRFGGRHAPDSLADMHRITHNTFAKIG
jgi:hypothetical protein